MVYNRSENGYNMKLVHIKLPEELKAAIEEVARAKGNTFSSEVRDRLYSTLGKRGGT